MQLDPLLHLSRAIQAAVEAVPYPVLLVLGVLFLIAAVSEGRSYTAVRAYRAAANQGG